MPIAQALAEEIDLEMVTYDEEHNAKPTGAVTRAYKCKPQIIGDRNYRSTGSGRRRASRRHDKGRGVSDHYSYNANRANAGDSPTEAFPRIVFSNDRRIIERRIGYVHRPLHQCPALGSYLDQAPLHLEPRTGDGAT